MLTEDREEFRNIVEQACLMANGEKPNATGIMLWYNAFSDHDLEDIKIAFSKALLESSGRLVFSKVHKFLKSKTGHPTPEQAWNHVPKSEHESAYVTDEIMQALASCSDSLDRGDHVAARMAFIETYKQVINQTNTEPKWWFSAATGFDYENSLAQKEQALLTMGAKGWLTQQEIQKRLTSVYEQQGQELPQYLKEKKSLEKLTLQTSNGLLKTGR